MLAFSQPSLARSCKMCRIKSWKRNCYLVSTPWIRSKVCGKRKQNVLRIRNNTGVAGNFASV